MAVGVPPSPGPTTKAVLLVSTVNKDLLEVFWTWKAVVELVVDGLRPLQTEFQRLSADPSSIEGILKDSADRIRPVAQQTMAAANQAMGLG